MSRWILLVPFLIFGLGAVLFFSTESEVKVRFDRAQDRLREGQLDRAVSEFQGIVENYPKSGYAPRALWELATLYHSSLYELPEAVDSFRQLIQDYPESPFAAESLLRLADIRMKEYQDGPEAITLWREYLERWPASGKRREIQFEIGSALFQLGQLEEALNELRPLTDRQDETGQKSALTVATIFQLKKMYSESLEYFEKAAEGEVSETCRLQAQLGWIESLEFLGDLSQAIKVAQSIDSESYSPLLKEELLVRLTRKQKYYEPGLWEPIQN